MTKFNEGRHPGEFLMSEANGFRSRGKATIKAGAGVFEPGTVVGKVTASGKYAPSPNAEIVGIEGAQTAVAVTLYGGDATTVDVDVAIVERDAEVNFSKLKFDATVNDDAKRATKRAQLAVAGIIGR